MYHKKERRECSRVIVGFLICDTGSREPQVRINEVHDSFCVCKRKAEPIEKQPKFNNYKHNKTNKMKKIYFWSILILSMMVLLSQQAGAQSDVSVWDGFAESWTQGDGTENNPYLIENARQLAYIAEMVNAGVTHYDSTYFRLTTNIQIDSIYQWQPIGFDYTHCFSGNFDGDNHIIILYLTSSSNNSFCIFGNINHSSVHNLNRVGKIKCTSWSEVGIFGSVFSSFIKNCNNYCDIEITQGGSGRIGGIVGDASASTIANCSNYGSITSSPNISSFPLCGGICGSGRRVNITKSYNKGNNSCPSEYMGGIIGSVFGAQFSTDTTTITDCYNSGDLTSLYSVSGICGRKENPTYGDVHVFIRNNYNSGILSCTGSTSGISLTMSGISPTYSGYITNCYYLNTCGDNTSSGGTPKTEAQMKSPSFPIILNSDSVVYIMDTLNINQGYPIFANEIYVLTNDADNITFNSATLNGIYSGNADIKGFRYKAETDSAYNTVYCSLSEPYSYSLSGLSAGTTYQYYYFVQKNGATYYGNAKTFSTITCDVSINLTMPTEAVCTGDSVLLIAAAESAHTSQFSYQWSTGESGNTILPSSNGLYTVTATADNGCSQTSSYTLSLYPSPAGIISGDTVLCEGSNAVLSASGAWSYQWNTGTQGNSITVAAPGVYTCTFTNEYGCTSERSITVSTLSDIAISGNPHVCEGGSTLLSAPAADSCLWSTGAQNFSILVSTPGTYTVTIYQGQCSASTSVVVTAASLPTPSILGNTTICQNQTTNLTANGGNSYLWSNGSTNNSISVSQSGVYTVTAINAEGCSASTNVTVTVNPLPNVNITGNSSFCQGDNTTLTATGASTYVWSNSSNDNAITVNNAGTYTVTGTDANGCSNIATKTVSVNPTYNIPLTHSMCEGESYNFYGQNITAAGTYTHTLQTINGCDSVLTLTLMVKALPTPSISGNTALCEGESTTLTANGGISYNWSNGSATNSVNVAESGIYTVTATNVEGCTATASATVTVNPLPIVVIGGNTSICEGGSTTLTASGADTYSWSTGDNTASATVNAFGIYTVTGTSVEGCSNTSEVTVLVSQLPVITISGETDICAGESTTLTANGGTTYLWSNGTTDATLTVSNAGTYQVIGYNEAGCNAMASATVNVWQPASSEFSIECSDSCYTWNDQSYCTSGDYTQTFTAANGCDSVVTLHLTITVGIDDHNLAASMTVYPNPTSGIVNVQCTMNNVQVETMEILVYDAFGRLLRSTDGVETQNFASLQTDTHGSSVQTQIDLSRYAPGVYLVKAVADGNVVAVRKIVKN